MIDFVLPKRERNSTRPYHLTHLQVELLQRLANGEQLKEMVTANRDVRCMWHQAWKIRMQMAATHNAHAVAMALREGIIK